MCRLSYFSHMALKSRQSLYSMTGVSSAWSSRSVTLLTYFVAWTTLIFYNFHVVTCTVCKSIVATAVISAKVFACFFQPQKSHFRPTPDGALCIIRTYHTLFYGRIEDVFIRATLESEGSR